MSEKFENVKTLPILVLKPLLISNISGKILLKIEFGISKSPISKVVAEILLNPNEETTLKIGSIPMLNTIENEDLTNKSYLHEKGECLTLSNHSFTQSVCFDFNSNQQLQVEQFITNICLIFEIADISTPVPIDQFETFVRNIFPEDEQERIIATSNSRFSNPTRDQPDSNPILLITKIFGKQYIHGVKII